MLILTVLAAGGVGALVYHHLVQRDLQKQVKEHGQQLSLLSQGKDPRELGPPTKVL
jgi:hypothetical protein